MQQDDGWAYARSVEELLKTGVYSLDAWSAANMPVQVYFAAALAQVFGYSLSLLKFATLLLLAVGIASFFALLREIKVSTGLVTLLTLVLFANPLALMLSFTFMSDVQFMGWLLLAQWLYVRGFRTRSGWTVLLGSLAAGCAIGTRQFGMAVIPGLVLAWVMSATDRKPPLPHLLLGVMIPIVMSLWQINAALTHPNFTQAVRLHEQNYFVTRPALFLLKEMTWRAATLIRYLGLLMLPLLPLLFAWFARSRFVWRSGSHAHYAKDQVTPFQTTASIVLCAMLVVAAFARSPLTTRPGEADRAMPLWWMLPTTFWEYPPLLTAMGVIGLIGGCLLIFMIVRIRMSWRVWRRMSMATIVPWSTGLFLFGLHLCYVQLNDTYLVGLLPFAVLVPAYALRRRKPKDGWVAISMGLAVAIVVLLSLSLRGDYNRQEAEWQASDRMRAAGVHVRCIGGSRHWAEYHGAFDDWLAATYPSFNYTRGDVSPAAPGPLHDPFYAWLEKRSWSALYRIQQKWEQTIPEGWVLHDVVHYRDALFRLKTVQILRRTAAQLGDAEECPTTDHAALEKP